MNARKIGGMMLALLLAAGGAFAEMESSVDVSVDLASAYVFRGATFNDGLVLQPGVEVSGAPVTFGVWGNLDLDDYDGAVEDGQFSEIDIYASYDLPGLPEMLGASLGYTEYTYPSGGGDADREVFASFGLNVPAAPSVTVNYGVDGGIDKTLYVEFGAEHEVTLIEDVSSITLSAALGYVDPDEGESGLSHGQVGLSVSYSFLSAGVTYVGQIDDDVLPDVEDEGPYDVEVYGTLGCAVSF